MTHINRREALRRLGLGAAALALPFPLGCSSPFLGARGRSAVASGGSADLESLSPVDRLFAGGRTFSGDANPNPFHKVLWNKASAPPATGTVEECPVVIVGGGVGGLLSAYLLRDLQPILLDSSERFGGNARGQAWKGVEYSIGAAYLMAPEAGSSLDKLYAETGVFDLCRRRKESDPVMLNQEIYEDFWSGQTDPQAAAQIRRLRDYFVACAEGTAPVPSIPPESPEDKSALAQLDREDFLSHLEKKMGGPLHPHAATALELYCWSTLGASMSEVSAAVALNFYSGEFMEILVPPAGNASVAERFLQLVARDVPLSRLRSNALVYDVRPFPDHVEVRYVSGGATRVIRAKAVVMACPKFIAGRLIDGYSQERGDALARMGYRSYVVGNACLSRKPARAHHDLYLLGSGALGAGDAKARQGRHGTTDVILANFSQGPHDHTVLTMYHSLPFDGARPELLSPAAYDRFEARLRADLTKTILQPLGYAPGDLSELRLARWGHPIPYPKPGFYRKGSPEALSRPIGGRIFFVNQDTWAAPAIETSLHEALHWMPKAREACG